MSLPDADQVLPMRQGPRPSTTATTPHEQLDQNATQALQDALWERMSKLPDTAAAQSQIAPSGSRALLSRAPGTVEGAFMVGREFAHLHPYYDGSLHLTLDKDDVEETIKKGWAEPHPLAGIAGPAGAVMVYGPRDEAELEAIWAIVLRSHRFANRRQ